MIIKPKSEIIKTKADVSEFPALKLFFPMDETNDGSITDAVNGQTIPWSGAEFTTTPNAVTSTISDGTGDVELDVPIPIGTSRALLIIIGDTGAIAGLLDLKESGSTQSKIGFSASNHTITDGTNSANVAKSISGDTAGVALHVVPGTANEGNCFYTSELASDAIVTTTATPGDLSTIPTIGRISCNAEWTLYSVALWVFDTYEPTNTEINSVLARMLTNHKAGSKHLPPEWIGKS